MSVFLGYVEEIPTQRAERLLDAAASAHPSKEWIETLSATLAQADRDDDGDDAPTPSLFRLNGQAVALVELKGHLSAHLGAGFGVN